MSVQVGDVVTWNWAGGTAKGEVIETFTQRVSRTLKDTEVVRNASSDCPAFLIRQDDGDEVLKSITEIEKG